MSIFQAIVLGIIQGLTEFLPISSSGHLVILPFFLNWQLPQKEAFIFNVLVQIGTLVAVLITFRKEIGNILVDFFQQLRKGTPFATVNARLGWLLIIATVPAGLAGVFLNDVVEQTFSSPLFAGIALLITGLMMVIGERVNLRIKESFDITILDALVMGGMQALALFPGISRSGATISGGMMRHIRRKDAGNFSFLMSIPIMIAAGGLSIYDLIAEVSNLGEFLPIMATGFITAGIVGYLAIRWLLKFLKSHSLVYFSIYCFIMGTITILIWGLT